MTKSIFTIFLLASACLSGCASFDDDTYGQPPQQRAHAYNDYQYAAQPQCFGNDCLGPCMVGDPGCTPNGPLSVATPFTAEYAPCGAGPCPANIPQPVPCAVQQPCLTGDPCLPALPCAPNPFVIQQQLIFQQPQANAQMPFGGSQPCLIDPCAVPQPIQAFRQTRSYSYPQLSAQQPYGYPPQQMMAPQQMQQAMPQQMMAPQQMQPQYYAGQQQGQYIPAEPNYIQEPAYVQAQQAPVLSALQPGAAPATYVPQNNGYVPPHDPSVLRDETFQGDVNVPAPMTIGPISSNGALDTQDQLASAGVASGDVAMDWAAQEGATLRVLLQDWSERAGWRLVWNTDREYVVEAGAVFKGKYIDVASALIRAFSRATPAPQAIFYKGNRVLVVTALEGENAE